MSERNEDRWPEAPAAPVPPRVLSPVERAAIGLQKAATWFEEYEKLHADKRTPDGYRKAIVNCERAAELRELAASLVQP